MNYNTKALKELIVNELMQKPGSFKERISLDVEKTLQKSSVWKRVSKEINETCVERIFCPHGLKNADGEPPDWVDDISVQIVTDNTDTKILDFEFCVD